jgi:4-amino-4-deoxy-L-arabinose transferase-like glycosyltransferase
VLLAIAVAAGLFALCGALAPETEYDAVWYHLGLPQAWLEAGSVVATPDHYPSLYPMGTELLYAYGLALGDPVVAKLVHLAIGLLLAAATYELGRHAHSPAAGLAAVAILAAAPTVLWEATTAYVDLATALFLTLALRWTMVARRDARAAPLVVSAATAGLALWTKHIGLFGLAAVAALYLLPDGRPPARRLRAAAAFGATALAIAAPWYLRSLIESGNPLFPSFYDVLGASSQWWDAHADAALSASLDRFGHRDGVLGVALLPWDLVMHGPSFGGTLGVAPLLLAPFGLAAARRSSTLAAVALATALYAVLWAAPFSSQQARFLVPIAPALAVLGGAGLVVARRALGALDPRLGTAGAALVAALLVLSLPPFAPVQQRDEPVGLTHVITDVPLAVVSGAQSRTEYLAREVETYPLLRRLESGPGRRLLAIADPPATLYANVPLVPGFAKSVDVVYDAAAVPAAVHRELRAAGITHVLVDRRERRTLPSGAPGGPVFARRYLQRVDADANAVLYRLR